MTETTTAPLAQTALHALHLELGARMVPFAGYSMPVQYRDGVLKEHLHTRAEAGLFDVSHMGQVMLSGTGAAAALETLVPVDILALPVGQQRYAVFTNEHGGVMDDLMVANFGSFLLVVVNAACKDQDIAHMRERIGMNCHIDVLSDRSLLAIQGPAAVEVMARFVPELASLLFMSVASVEVLGVDCLVSRSGYTGEDGFEISVPSYSAERLARELLRHPEVKPIGLGARDSLRLEAGLCLYGHDLDAQTTPIEGSLLWALSKVRRAGGARAGGYPGSEAIQRQISQGAGRKRVGLLPRDRIPIREGVELVDQGCLVGVVTSGGFGPTLNAPCAMGYVSADLAHPGTVLQAVVRGKPVPVEIVRTPFVPQRYYRG